MMLFRKPDRRVRPAPARKLSGFTLVEILTVVVILGIVSAVILPQIGSRDDLRAAAAARIVIADLIYAQNLAIATQRTTYVRFDGDAYGIYESPTATTPVTHPISQQPYTARFGDSGSPGLNLTTVVSRSFDGLDILAFDELGAPYSYNTVTSSLSSLVAAGEIVIGSGSHRLRVSVEPFTGEVVVTPVAP